MARTRRTGSFNHRRHVVLFLAAIVLPSLVLIALTLRAISQEHELAEQRAVDHRRSIARQFGQELLFALERIKLAEAARLDGRQGGSAPRHTPGHPVVAIVARVDGSRLLLPWDVQQETEDARRLLAELAFARQLRAGERYEHAARQPARAAERYRGALEVARHAVQRAQARLAIARALTKLGRQREALMERRRVLDAPATLVDAQGVALFLYAARALVGEDDGAVLERLAREDEPYRWWSPSAAYLLVDILETIADSSAEPAWRADAQRRAHRMAPALRDLGGALTLQREFTTLGLSADLDAPPRWLPLGAEPWLVSVAPAARPALAAVVAVRVSMLVQLPDELDAELAALLADARLSTEPGRGDPLGPSFPGVSLDVPRTAVTTPDWEIRRGLYVATLLLVLTLTLFGAYLVWHDVRRELGLAELRSHFVSSVSHELKTPLTAIRMYAETLKLDAFQDPSARAEYLETIVGESERLSRLLNNVLDFAKIERGERAYHLEPTALADVVRRAVRAIGYPLTQLGFTLRTVIDDDLPRVPADADALEQAILNLLTNAMKYSGESREIELRLSRRDGQAAIEVEDHGVGISASEQPHVLERFYRVPGPENRHIPGTGLGLTIVDHVTRGHGGQVVLHSAPGMGSTFVIRIPIAEEGK